ncbi:siphovirus ReqiPepy6 Gp37-like family protein [Lysinibacillus sp. NPDC093216]|uniref:siphovirus ReqiPepy6 Gp37-like family protein n=1 Tax=Lysinibacillus sp. NPDC093216 TaxID=3390576 RepID=UPI003D0394AE
MYLNIFDVNFNRLGIIDEDNDIDFTLKYHDHSILIATIDANKDNVAHFFTDEIRILTKSTDLRRGYIIENAEFKDENKTEILIMAKSLSIMMGWRIIEWQQIYKGNIEDVLKSFVNANAINPTLANRKIPNLVLGPNTGIDIITEEAYNNKMLDESLWEMCIKHDVSFEILMNHTTKNFEFIVYQGADRSTEQTVNPHIIFSKAFDNVNTQSYIDDMSNYKSTAYVAGEGEGDDRTVLRLNDNFTGFERREIFFDARDLQSNYKNENDEEVTLTPKEYEKVLTERGLNRLSEYPRIQTFKSDNDSDSQFVFGKDYFLGDKTTSRNDEVGLVMHSRVVVVKENYNENGCSSQTEFGTAVPTIIDKIKKVIK